MSKPIYILNGPNLNLLGKREPEIYGTTTLAELDAMSVARAKKAGFSVIFRQTNREGELVEWLHEARDQGSAVVINAAAYSHTSIAIHDALKAVDLPVVEVHLSNVHRRESFRHHSHVSAAADGIIIGLGAHGYELAVDAAIALVAKTENTK
jgi:3-dehydroquinate dehydratase-2